MPLCREKGKYRVKLQGNCEVDFNPQISLNTPQVSVHLLRAQQEKQLSDVSSSSLLLFLSMSGMTECSSSHSNALLLASWGLIGYQFT